MNEEEENKTIETLKYWLEFNIKHDTPNSAHIVSCVGKVLNLVEKKDKIIDLMAKEMKNKEYEYEDMCLYSEDCHGEYCEQCIKEYFRKKVENE